MPKRPPNHDEDHPPDDRSSAHVSDNDFLKVARDAIMEPDSTSIGNPLATFPKTIAKYRIIAVLGSGGMGVVYEAEQSEPRRAVALKVVRASQYIDEYHVRLFQREAQTLARLKHPGIAAIYESGCTDDGQHFFAMELVRGDTFSNYLQQHPLNIRERLDLFRSICESVNYAHQRGVIHRDLKPSNIYVDLEGHPKLLDFGLARITETDMAAVTLITQIGRIQGTLSYMSPEQARGNPDEIDLRSDVYSLGVILYELLTGQLPYDISSIALPNAVRAICEDKPCKPSIHDRTLRGDLETIVLTALEKEPHRRYQSAAILAEDIGRFLSRQPILARPPSTIYQFRKLMERHRAGTVLVALLLMMILGFSISMGVLFKRAEQEARIAQAVTGFMIDSFRVSDPNFARGNTITAQQILDQCAGRIASAFEAPIIQAKLMETIATAYRNLSLYEAATEQFESAYQIRSRIQGMKHPDVAESLINLGTVWKFRGDFHKARDYHQRGWDLHKRSSGADHEFSARAMSILAGTLTSLGQFRQAERLARAALGEQKNIYGKRHLEISYTLHTLAAILFELGDYEESEGLLNQSLSIRRALTDSEDPHLLTPRTKIALVQAVGEYDKALSLLAEALSKRRNSHGDAHMYITNGMAYQGQLLRDAGKSAEANSFLREAMNRYQKRKLHDHPYLARVMTDLGWTYLDMIDIADANLMFIEARRIYKHLRLENHPEAVKTLTGLAQVAFVEKRYEEAEQMLRDAIRVLKLALRDDHWAVVRTENMLGECLISLLRYQEAEPLLLRSYAAMNRYRGNNDRYVQEAITRLIKLYTALHQPEKVKAYSKFLINP